MFVAGTAQGINDVCCRYLLLTGFRLIFDRSLLPFDVTRRFPICRCCFSMSMMTESCLPMTLLLDGGERTSALG